MEVIIDALTAMITGDFQIYLDKISTADYPLTAPSRLALGGIDLDKNRDAVTAFIAPDDESYDEDTAAGGELTTARLDVFIFLKRESQDKLTRKILRYGRAFRDMVRTDPSLGGSAGYAHLESAEYFDGVEGSDAIKGIKLSLSILNEE